MAASQEHTSAMTVAKEHPTQHVPRHVTRNMVQEQVHGTGVAGRINTWLAVRITKGVGTMWCAYVFAVLGASGIAAALTNNTEVVLLVGAISGYFLQLVLLPIIIVGQNVISTAQDARAEADHETLTALHTINVQQLEILRQQHSILEALGKA
jgi:predicted aconitase with swiveling domain